MSDKLPSKTALDDQYIYSIGEQNSIGEVSGDLQNDGKMTSKSSQERDDVSWRRIDSDRKYEGYLCSGMG